MITYSVAGLHFARTLLKTKDYAPRLDKSVKVITTAIPAGMLLGFVLNQLVFSMSLAFILNCGFVTLFVAMGYYALKAGKPLANIFLISSVTAAICITISTLAVAGFLVPYNDYTFKAIEVGMTFEAFLLAVILAKQFRVAEKDKVMAENYARTDTLTTLNNRHGFEESTQPLWSKIIREKRDVSVVLFDIDAFKKVNDNYGHSAGDLVLKHVADVIKATMRARAC
jgi:GGDEF domain-containing protein